MRRPLTVLIKPASSRCNLNCTYCFYLEKQSIYPWSTHPAMSLDTFRTFLEQYARISAPYVSFAWQGGEPTMMGLPWFQEVLAAQVRAANAHGVLRRSGQWEVTNALQTNGTLLDDAWAEFFHGYNFLIGLSLDGPPEWHDRYRVDRKGEGQHAKVLRAVELLRRHKVDFNILCVVSAANVDKPRELLRYYTRLGLDNLQFIPCVEDAGGHSSTTVSATGRAGVAAGDASGSRPKGRALPALPVLAAQPGAAAAAGTAGVAGADTASPAGRFTEYSITPQQYGSFLSGLFDAWMDVGFRKLRIRYFDNLVQMMITGVPSICQLAPQCGYIVLEHNGDCYPCDFFVEPEWKLGNLHETTLEQMLESERFGAFAAMKPDLHPQCQSCRWKPLCYGECPRYRIIGSGSAPGQLPYFCESYRAFFPHTHKRLARTAETVRRELAYAPS